MSTDDHVEDVINSGSRCSVANDDDGAPLRLIDVKSTLRLAAAAEGTGGGICFGRWHEWHVISHTWSKDVRDLSDMIGQNVPEGAGSQHYNELFRQADFRQAPGYKSLLELLKILDADGVAWVWYDAMCINQKSKAEKEAEIGRMGAYYGNCRCCYVLLHGLGQGYGLHSELNPTTSPQVCKFLPGPLFWLRKIVSYLRSYLPIVFGESSDDTRASTMTGTKSCVSANLPRWFTRAWTFQELLLPKHIRFILQVTSPKDTQLMCIAYRYLEMEACVCCGPAKPSLRNQLVLNLHNDPQSLVTPNYMSPDKLWIALTTKSTPSYVDINSQYWEQNHHWEQKHHSLMHHAMGVPGKPNWYFVDDRCFAFLIHLEMIITNGRLHDSDDELLDCLNIRAIVNEPQYFDTKASKVASIIDEISTRDCSNEEDRVLSVLKLLGVEGVVQVRTDKSLESQIVYLAKQLIKKQDKKYSELLLFLCMAHGFGYGDKNNMSWAPRFGKRLAWQKELVCPKVIYQYLKPTDLEVEGWTFQQIASITEVRDDNSLIISTEVLKATLVSHHHRDQSTTSRELGVHIGGDNRPLTYIRVHVSKVGENGVCEIEDEWENTCIAFPTSSNGLHNLKDPIPVWLVKLGKGTDDMVYCLVCIGDNVENLHKIGFMTICEKDVLQSKFKDWHDTQTCVIGGLDDEELIKRLFEIEHQETSIELQKQCQGEIMESYTKLREQCQERERQARQNSRATEHIREPSPDIYDRLAAGEDVFGDDESD